MTTQGEELIEHCKEHVIATMQTLPECAPNGMPSEEAFANLRDQSVALSRHSGWYNFPSMRVSIGVGRRWQGGRREKV